MFKSARKQQLKSPEGSGAEEAVLETGGRAAEETGGAQSPAREETTPGAAGADGEAETREWARSDDAAEIGGFDASDGWEKAIRARAASGQVVVGVPTAGTDLKSRIAAVVNSKVKLTLMQKGLVLVCVPLLVNLVFAFVLGAIAEESERAYIRESQSKAIITKANILTKLLIDAGFSLGAYSVSRNPASVEHYEQSRDMFKSELQQLHELVKDKPVQVENLRNIEESAGRGISILEKIRESIETGSRISALMSSHRMFKELKALIEQLEEDLNAFTEEERRLERAAPTSMKQARLLGNCILWVMLILNCVLAILMHRFFFGSIVQALRQVTDNSFRLARGEPLNPPVGGNDEIAHLDRVFHEVADALNEAWRKERAVLENAQDVICSIDEEGRFTKVSQAAGEVWGFPADELIGRPFTDIIDPDDVTKAIDATHAIMMEQSDDPFETRILRRDGRMVHILWSAHWSSGERSMFCVAHDITERKKAEQELRASEARVRSIVESMPVGLLILDKQGYVEIVNPHGEDMLGYRFEQLVGEHVSLLFPKHPELDSRKFTENPFDKLVGRVREFEAQRRDGEVFPAEMTLTEWNTVDGMRYLAIMLNVADRHELERMKREFVSTVSHELRTPLTSIRGSLTLLAVGALGKLNDNADKAVKIAERNTVRLINLINDLLDIEKLEAGKLEMTFADVAADGVIDRSVESVRSFAEQYGIKFDVKKSDARVFADGDRLVQVLVNLLSNAVKYSPKDEVVHVAAQVDGDKLRFTISDKGRGIPADFIGKVFERFEQVETADATKRGGTGLGLAICKAIVEQHKGTIGVESEVGKGSMFWFCIPLAGGNEASASE